MRPLCTIVGVGPGLGYSLAKRFSAKYTVGMISRDTERLITYEQELAGTVAKPADARDKEALRAVLRELHDAYGPTEALIYNAAAVRKSSIDDNVDSIIDDLRTSVGGAIIAIQEVLPLMRERGSILFTGGGFAERPHPKYVSLSLAKAGIRNLAQNIAKATEGSSIYVGLVTIDGRIAHNTSLDPDLLAETFWQMHMDKTVFEKYQK